MVDLCGYRKLFLRNVNFKKRIWISWETQRRSVELSKKLGCRLYIIEKKGFLRYPFSFFKTLVILMDERPGLLFVQNPSMILAALACIYGLITKTFIIVDRHTTFRLNKPHSGSFRIWLFMRLHYFTLKKADLTIVTNNYLAQLVELAGGNPFVLPDMLPSELNPKQKIYLKGGRNILLISSFGLDEPIYQVIEAMKDFIEDDSYLYITGNYKKLDAKLPEKVPPNIIFTGFIPEQQFIDMLFSVDAAMALTTSDYCMLCGCYEVVSAQKPLIASDKKVLKDYFDKAVFVDNSSLGISKGIREVINNLDYYTDQSKKMNKEISRKWEKLYDNLESYLPQHPI